MECIADDTRKMKLRREDMPDCGSVKEWHIAKPSNPKFRNIEVKAIIMMKHVWISADPNLKYLSSAGRVMSGHCDHRVLEAN